MPFGYYAPPGFRGGFNPNFLHVAEDDSGSGYSLAQSAPASSGNDFYDNGFYAPSVGASYAPGGNGPIGQQSSAMRAIQMAQPQDRTADPTAQPMAPSGLLSQLQRAYGGAQQAPSYGRAGRDYILNGRQGQIPGDVADPNDWLQQQANAARGPVRSDQERIAALRQDPRFTALPFQQRDAVFKQFTGSGQDDYELHNLKIAKEMMDQEALRKKGYADDNTSLAHALDPRTNINDFAVTYNSDPKNHPNQYLIPAREAYSTESGEFVPKTQEEWKMALPSLHARALANLRAQGGGGDADSAFFADYQGRLKAREQELLAKGGPAASAPQSAPSVAVQAQGASIPPFGPFSAQPFGDPSSARTPFQRDVRSVAGQLSPWLRAIMSAPGRVATAASNGLSRGAESASSYFTGEPIDDGGGIPRTKYLADYIPEWMSPIVGTRNPYR